MIFVLKTKPIKEQEETYNMFNRQLKRNIKALDAEISKLSKEIKELEYDSRYEMKKRTVEDLIEFRDRLMRGQMDNKSNEAVIELDNQIMELAIELSNLEIEESYLTKMTRLEELTNVRKQLSECKVKESNAPAIISGLVGISAILIILKYEQTDVITSKSFNIATSLFRRG